ncbi:hypothetical protein GM658_10805 [Pseudoduganella eburnea]|uniref:Uncharacterized protein n=1 Tax=Massilia eburnea TaxID=1776165 RepID=A0A6L6QFE1_9BURK|nr:hypothetical protein [Massilia eburnea]MTW11092.1 hypothetical protein [Massilia eburnea]
MEITAFAALTRNVIRDNGFDDFIPVARLPARHEIRGLDGIDHESEETQFKIVRRLNGTFDSGIFEA